MPLEEFKLLINIVGKFISHQSTGTSDFSSIPSLAPLVANITNAARKLTRLTNLRRIPIIPLLRLDTMRMTLADQWDLTFFGQVVGENGELVGNTIKNEFNQFVEAAYTE